MSGYFCGNPRNHEAHDTDLGTCEGIHRPVIKEEVIIETYTPDAPPAPPTAGPEFDPVKIPAHYNQGKIEVTNFIADQGLNFPRGNVVKYVARAGKKDPNTELQDLEKAAAYLQMAYNLAQGKPAVVRDPETHEVVWTLFKN